MRKKLLKLAADHFEADIEDLNIKNGNISVTGVPSKVISFAELADIAQSREEGPGPLMGQGNSALGENAPGFTT